MNNHLRLARPKHWVKNLLVFAPLFFAGAIFQIDLLIESFLAFISFCLVSSIVYVVNDIADYKQDQLHLFKKERPLASGIVSMHGAIAFIGFLLILFAVFLSFVSQIHFLLLLYIVLNILYSFYFKHIAMLDIMFVSLFYILRILAGGLATGIYVSPWIILCVLFGSLFVIVGKRRAEAYSGYSRKVLKLYSSRALDLLLAVSVSLAVISYGIWTIIAHEAPYLVYSTFFVLFALARLLNNIYLDPIHSQSPELLVFKDKWIFSSFVLWVVYLFFIFYKGV